MAAAQQNLMCSFLGSVERQRQVSNNREVFTLGSVLRRGCRGKIVLLVQPELQEGEIGRSRHSLMKQLKTEIKWKINLRCSTLQFISQLCPWRPDGHRGGEPGLDSGQGQDVSLLHEVQTGSGAHPASYTVRTGGSFAAEKNLSNLWLFLYNAIINFSSSFISFRIPSNAWYFG
jgi:hypothetical protein